MIEKILYPLSRLFGDGPITRQDVQQVIACYASLPVTDQLRIWGRLICLQPILKAIDQHIPVTKGMIVDVGCGYGLVSLLVALRRPQGIIGIEASLSRWAIARQALQRQQGVTIQHGSIPEEPIPRSAAILLIDVLYLFSDETQRQILIKCGRALISNGLLLIKDNTTVPMWKHRYAALEEKIKLALGAYGVETRRHPNYHTPCGWHRLVNQGHLIAIEECFIQSIAPYPGVIYICRKKGIDTEQHPRISSAQKEA